MKIFNVQQGRSNMTSLQGYVDVGYRTLVDLFGEPHYDTPSGDEKVSTEWELCFQVEDFFGEEKTVYATIYDWKDYDGGMRSRNSDTYEWHIGGFSQDAVESVRTAIESRVGVAQ
jgi:hypothetical protein